MTGATRKAGHVFECPECGESHEGDPSAMHVLLPCAFDDAGEYRRGAVLYAYTGPSSPLLTLDADDPRQVCIADPGER
jgi:hypothetical protein